ncbi:type II CAAX endopeptidase family protein [Saccharopolyspora shandongensis]|uniref:CPBP family intramembrane glutamic endopeptidase n=1 Tax=Saccharopolyspora shandongensis TaxID=418495 RepID=UPI0033C31BDA
MGEQPEQEPREFPKHLGEPMRPVEDTTNADLHPRFWEAQLEAARRGSLAWGFAAFFIGYGGYYLTVLILNAVRPSRAGGFDPTTPPNTGPLLLLAFAPNILLGLVPAVFSWWRGRGLRSDFGILPKRRDFKVGLACGGIALLGSWALTLVIIAIAGPPPETDLARLMQGERTVWLFLFALFAFLGAPLTEELLMRGALWGALEHYRIPRYAILVLTALIFALIHQEVWRTPVLFFGGLAIGAARMITGRVAASMIAHATNNFLPALLLFAIAR